MEIKAMFIPYACAGRLFILESLVLYACISTLESTLRDPLLIPHIKDPSLSPV